jgi:hypothetical protein
MKLDDSCAICFHNFSLLLESIDIFLFDGLEVGFHFLQALSLFVAICYIFCKHQWDKSIGSVDD